MLDNEDPHLTSLLAAAPPAQNPDYELAANHVPILKFDLLEPFLPLAAGYSVMRRRMPSRSFPRTVDVESDEVAVEYAIWWDWDIGHLYELEHIWLYLDPQEELTRAEASWHGVFHSMSIDTSMPISNKRLVVYSEPGKHAFAPAPAWFRVREAKTRWDCCQGSGSGGVHMADLFKGVIRSQPPAVHSLVRAYLRQHAFVPTYQFDRTFEISPEMLVPWPKLRAWIPDRLAHLVEQLERAEPFESDTPDCERAA